jgi:site-specific recombinase XerD
VAHWRLARLPRCLSAEEVNRLIAACDGAGLRRLRDRAIILMLVRLGLRSGDVARLRLTRTRSVRRASGLLETGLAGQS